MSTADALDEALASFEELARAQEVGDAWEADSVLPGYSVGGLTAHVAQGIGWLAAIAAQEPADIDDLRVVQPGGYFAVLKREPDPPADENHDAIVSMGNAAAARGWQPTVEHLGSTGIRARTAVAGGDIDRIVDLRPTLPFGTSLRTFIATRVVELVVHGDDLAVSVGQDGLAPGDSAFRVAAELLVVTAVQHDPLAVMRALSRRERAPGDVIPGLPT
jgi:uncharacterized protein (TIGR03083 family)